MGQLKMHSLDKIAENIEKIASLFPNCITESSDGFGGVKRTVDFDMLKQELSDYVVEGLQERYQFTWPDKKKAMLAANAPINKTLRPCREESVDFDNTENLYIEGDNLEVMKLLQETYLGKVKMIYIDPPYNTGNDFVYNDDFAQEAEEYMANSGQYSEEGNRLVANTESNGRFHTDWLNMMYPRLKLAKDLLKDDGVIFISIDDCEYSNLKKICDEIFGTNNFIASIVWQKKTSPDARMNISAAHDYILVYGKHNRTGEFLFNYFPYTGERLDGYRNPDNDPRGDWASVDMTGQTGRAPKTQFYEITTPSGKKYLPPEGRCWALALETYLNLVADNRIWFGENGDNRPRVKKFLSEANGQRPWTWWDNKFASYNQESNKELMKLFNGKLVFDNPKPVKLLEKLLLMTSKSDEKHIIMDFFSGSASIAEAVIRMNLKDNGNRNFICVQIPELISSKGNQFKANNIALDMGFKTICEIGKERIRRAGQKIKEDNPLTTQELDIGFRVLKLDSSNMEDIYYTPKEYMEKEISLFVDNVKADRSSEDLLFQVMLDLGTSLSSKIVKKEIAGKEVFDVANGHIMACFDKDVSDDVITAIAKEKPSYFVMRDNSLADDSVALNFDQIFNTYSPNTERKVL